MSLSSVRKRAVFLSCNTTNVPHGYDQRMITRSNAHAEQPPATALLPSCYTLVPPLSVLGVLMGQPDLT